MYQKAVFIFRRDLRIHDNSGLLFALENAKEVIPIFIFTPEQIEKNPYRSDFSLQFMIESLEDLESDLKEMGGKLFYFYDHPEKVIGDCIEKLGVDLVVLNRDFTPYSIARDRKIEKISKEKNVSFKSLNDLSLHPPEELLKANGEPYTIFTPFHKNALKMDVDLPKKNSHHNYWKVAISFARDSSILSEILPKRKDIQKGGRKEALKILKKLSHFTFYETERNFPAKDSTTHLSPHLKFTTISPREAYHAFVKSLGENHGLVRSLYWRDFFYSISFYFPHVFSGCFHKKYDQLEWEKNSALFKHWCEGTTGFPIVDAGMRQLNQTGYMHNRVRMIVASFLVKDLHISWQQGELYFAKHLIDYDPALNNGNWQWSASTGCDAQPYFRIFNPWSQQLNFDPDCEYIKKWVPELENKEPKTIHNWYKEPKTSRYPLPIVDHAIESKKALAYYKDC